MPNEVLNSLWETVVASSGGILLTLLVRRPLRQLFGPSIAYLAWLTVPASLFVLMPPGRTVHLPALPMLISVPSFASSLPSALISSGINWCTWCLWMWGSGILMCGLGLARQQLRFMSSLGLLHESDGVLRAERSLGSPAVVGLWRPKVVVPRDFETRYGPEERALILAHEQMHLRRGDLVVNAIWALARCIFWFNPLVHIASWLIRLDQELACDAAVIRNHPKSRKLYARAMLNTQLASAIPPLGCHWPSIHPLKERIMLLKLPSPRGFRRIMGNTMVGTLVLAAGYGAWAAQPEMADAPASSSHMDVATPKIVVNADVAQIAGSEIHYQGNVVITVIGNFRPISVLAKEVTMQANGDALFEGNVQIQLGNRKFNTKRAIMLGGTKIRTFKMDEAQAGST